MCGRYNIVPDVHAWADVAAVLGEVIREALQQLPARYNIAPTQTVPIVIPDEQGQPRLVEARWGYIPPWWKESFLPPKTFNARAEEAANKPMWRHPWRHQRCLVPASGWYEWAVLETGQKKPTKIPHHLLRQNGREIMFAGLWSVVRVSPDAEPMPTCAIVTTASAPSIAEIHERMPVVLHPEFWLPWIDPRQKDAQAVNRLVADGAVEQFSRKSVGTTVSNARHEGAQCVEPLPWPELDQHGVAAITVEQLHELRTLTPELLVPAYRPRIEPLWGDASAHVADVRLWIRELDARPDADAFADFIRRCRAFIREQI